MKKIGAEVILTAIIAPFLIWFASFVIASYKLEAMVDDQKTDILEIKSDVKYIKNYLMEKK